MDKVERYEIGLDKITEEIDRIEKKLDTEDMSDVKRHGLRMFQHGLCMAMTYLIAPRVPKLNNRKEPR